MIQRLFIPKCEPFVVELRLRFVNAQGETTLSRAVKLWHNPESKQALPWLVQIPCSALRRAPGQLEVAPPHLICEIQIHDPNGQVTKLGFTTTVPKSPKSAGSKGEVRMQPVLAIIVDSEGLEFVQIERAKPRKKSALSKNPLPAPSFEPSAWSPLWLNGNN